MAAVLRLLAEQLRLQGEYVIKHAIDPPALEPVIGDDPRVLELTPE
ncbi:MAG TPA: hypothetical protein VKE27_10685 [Candidatus Dormibacteraeota bacterium]|nr:hypothetical protein [Candidatus Dormibacteraeota bacterium]